MNPENSDKILQELQRITNLLVALLTKDQIQQDQIAMLSRIGFQPTEIAKLVGTTAKTVNATLYRIRKKGKGRKTHKK